MPISINVTRRDRKRTLRNGKTVMQPRYVVNFREPRTGKRKQLFFTRQKDANAKRAELSGELQTGTYSEARGSTTVAEIVQRWLTNRKGEIKSRTLHDYHRAAAHIIGPILSGTVEQRAEFTSTGKLPQGTRVIAMLGSIRVRELTTADIRAWHRTLVQEIGHYSANRAKMFLGTSLALAAEDLMIRPPAMPIKLGHGRTKAKKSILTSEQVAHLLDFARRDSERGIYIAFPFLAGTRPSEQLGLLWGDIDFDANVIRIQRMQERDGQLSNFTKTTAGTREIPMCPLLRSMLLEWRVACPRFNGELHRVFPGPGIRQAWPKPRAGGGPLIYHNFRHRFWTPALQRAGVPHVTPHSARHSFISTLQAQGVEVGLVAKLAGHSNANVTLGHYTQAVRGGQDAVAALERAYSA